MAENVGNPRMRRKAAKLKKELGLLDMVLYGTGIIIGAGIYVLVGEAIGIGGNATWLAFLFGGLIAGLTGLSFAELSSMYTKAAAEYEYVKRAFEDDEFGFVIGWLTLFASMFAISTVALGFGEYAGALFGVGPRLAGAGLIIFVGIINYMGIRHMSRINAVFTGITLLGVLIIIGMGVPKLGTVNYLAMPNGFAGITGAAALIFFAYLGFDDIVNVSEEVKDPSIIPKAIVICVAITSALYALLAVACVSIVPWDVLGHSSAPLAFVAETMLGPAAFKLLSIFALFSTASTVLIASVAATRMMYGMARAKVMPEHFGRITREQGTPVISIIYISLFSIFFMTMGGIRTIASVTDFLAFLIFGVINLSVILLRYSNPDAKRLFKVPLVVGRFPVLPFLGFMFCNYMLFNLDWRMWIFGMSIAIPGLVFYHLGLGKHDKAFGKIVASGLGWKNLERG